MSTIYQAIREGQSYGRLVQQVTYRKGQWMYRYCMWSGGPVKFSPWMQISGLPGAQKRESSVSHWKQVGYTRLVR
jgi:hypothetical protein